PLAEGFEEIEAMTSVDVLRRAGFDVVTAGLPGTVVTGSRGVRIFTDKKLEDVNMDEFDALVLVGGYPGYLNLGRSRAVLDAIVNFNSKNKVIAAICGAPSVLAKAGILDEKKATIYPGMEREIPRPRGDRVVVDGNVITSQGPGTAMEFALKIVEVLGGKEKSEKLKRDLVC
ncbi:MAG TPA: DJ-1/PfpI family protein, partial [Candidatus Aenigmarchaeota archaeon]|nr:DJ-1/PfpI family protein [Candidatus Aenigmarchaeota archaeon]